MDEEGSDAGEAASGAGSDADADADDEAGDIRCWLVDRRSRDENLVTLVYATTDGQRHLTKQLSWELLRRKPVTAAVDVDPDRLEPTPGDDERERYATQASRMAEEHDPDDEV